MSDLASELKIALTQHNTPRMERLSALALAKLTAYAGCLSSETLYYLARISAELPDGNNLDILAGEVSGEPPPSLITLSVSDLAYLEMVQGYISRHLGDCDEAVKHFESAAALAAPG